VLCRLEPRLLVGALGEARPLKEAPLRALWI